ncbi:hypothetical protein [Bacillus marinisedimentorum]|nr:hypothetical protein [Bacillus marinisedimentorum]
MGGTGEQRSRYTAAHRPASGKKAAVNADLRESITDAALVPLVKAST